MSLRVLDLAREQAGRVASSLLADLGADVTMIEPAGPTDGGPADVGPDYLRRRKRSVTLDLASTGGVREALRLAESVDAVIETFAPGELRSLGLGFDELRGANPDIVLASVTPFGQTGPRARWRATDLVVQAMGGLVASTGDADGPPRKLGGEQAAHVAGLLAAIDTAAAVRGVQAGVAGAVHIDVSMQEAMATHWTREIERYVYTGQETGRATQRLGLQGFPHTVETADGLLFLLPLRADWETFAGFLGLDQFATHEWADAETRLARWDEIEPHFLAAWKRRGRYEWFERAAEFGFTLAPLDDPHSLLASPQLAVRGFFEDVELTDGSTVRAPGLPFGVAAERAENRVPEPGAQNDALLGSSED